MANCIDISISLYTFTLIFIFVNCHTCVQRSPCICEYDDNRIINLAPVDKLGFLTAVNGNLTYYFHACSNKKPDLPKPNTTGDCGSTSLCLFNSSDTSITNLGKSEDAKFHFSTGEVPEERDVIYTLKNITTIITLACIEVPGSFLYVKESDANQHHLILFSTAACSFHEPHGLSTGSVLVIILCIIVLVYLIGGAAVLHFLRGARGKEMIPNIEFWTDLPVLVKDGAVFLQNGCKPTVSNSESYDRI